MMPKKIGHDIFYLSKDKRRLFGVGYNYDEDKYLSNDVTVFSEHITGKSIVDMDYQQSPNNSLWCVSEDGHIALLAKNDELKKIASSGIVTDGDFESVAVIQGDPTEMPSGVLTPNQTAYLYPLSDYGQATTLSGW